jgi:serine/threonine protein kinase
MAHRRNSNQKDLFHPVTTRINRRSPAIRAETILYPHERGDLAPWHLPRYIYRYWDLSDFNEEHPLRGVIIIANPKPGHDLPVLSLCKHQELITPQQTLKEYNHLLALSLLDLPETAKLLYTYVDPDTDRRKDGAYLETFYSIVVGDYSNSLRKEFLRATKFSAVQTLDIVKQLLTAVQAAHTKAIFHGAISPSNVLVERTGNKFRIKLVNFGQHAENVDANDMLEPYYRCPEYIAKYSKMSYPSDIWGIMTITIHLLTGLVVFRQSNDLIVLEEMVKYCGINKDENGESFPGDRFMSGLSKNTHPQLTLEGLTEQLRPKLQQLLGSNPSNEEAVAVNTLMQFIASCSFLRPSDRITSAGALNRFFGAQLENTLPTPHALYDEKDYYNFDGDMGEEDEEIEMWTQRMYDTISNTSFQQLDIMEPQDDRVDDNRGSADRTRDNRHDTRSDEQRSTK